MNVPEHLKFAASHEWVRVEDGIATVGISDHAQAELTDIVYLELPKMGRSVSAGEEVAVIESVKSASDIYSPVSGEIIEVNDGLADEPGAVNTDPYGQGWMFRIRFEGELPSSLLTATAYQGTIS
ncbi:MAG: glycine cleavage system protein GcvH [Verrucomicrobiota bacterium]